MSDFEKNVELMREYPIPQTLEDVPKYLYRGYAVFGIFLIAVIALTLYFR
ncbi:MAG: hypothetical protein ACOX47_00335 [Bacillota bacterium]|jgi:hypothetical protein